MSSSESHNPKGAMPLSPPQAEVIASGLLDSGFSCILQMPTGSGKTWLAERAIEATLARGARALYLTPLRALATELAARWRDRFASARVGVFTGDFGGHTSPYPVPFTEAQLLLMTPERLDACTRAWRTHWTWIPGLDLVVVDELHLLGEERRGPRLEGALSRLRRLNPFVRILALSATLGNRSELAAWLGAVEYSSTWRPIPLRWKIVRYKKPADKPDLLADEVSNNIRTGGKSLVFVQSRRRAEELSRRLVGLGMRASYHHGGLGPGRRQQIETGFRGADTDVVVATSTLEMGLNLPVRQVVLYDLQAFDGTDFQPLATNSVWQRVGRAGRPGLDTAGEGVLLAPAWQPHVDRYGRGQFEAIRSGLSDPRALAEQIVTEVAAGLARTPGQLDTVFRQSLAAHQGQLGDVGQITMDMLAAGMLREARADRLPHEPLILRVSQLGRVAVRHMLSPATVVQFRRVLTQEDNLSLFDLLLVATSSDDCEPVLPVDFEELDELASALAHERSTLLQRSRADLVSKQGIDGKRLLAALKMALVAREWTRMGSHSAVAEKHDCYPFEVERLCDSLDRLLLAMSAIVDGDVARESEVAQDPDSTPLPERIRALQRMITAGLDETAATLTLVPGIGPTLARRLHAAGVRDIEELALARGPDLATLRGVSAARAGTWIIQAEALVHTHSAFRYRDAGPTGTLTASGWPSNVDPYRLRRALDLSVTPADGLAHQVSGGLEPHVVHSDAEGRIRCDCADFARGFECKHLLAVKLHHGGDRQLRQLAKSLRSSPADASLDLLALWLAGRPLRTGTWSR